MAETYKTEDGTGSKLIFTYPFPVLKTEDVKVALNGGLQAATKYTVSLSPAQITFNNTNYDSTLQENTGAPKSGVKVRVFRNTEVDNPKARFAAGNSVRAADLNNNVDQALYALQEEKDQPLWDVDFEGGKINGVTIGATTPATGRFTSLELTTDSQFQVKGDLIIGDSIDDDNVGFLAKVGNLIPTGSDANGTNYSIYSLGNSTNKWKNLYIHDTAELAKVDINEGAIDGTIIGANSAAAGTFTTGTITTADINGGAIDGTTIGATTRAAGKFTNLSVNDNIICDSSLPKIRTATADGSDNKTLLISAGGDTATGRGAVISLSGNEASGVGDVAIYSGATTDGKITLSAGSSTTLGLTIDQDGKAVIPTADINGGAIDGTTIGGTTAAAGTFINLTATGHVALGDGVTDQISIGGLIDSDIKPYFDDEYNLGSTTKEFKNLYIDGVAYLDEVDIDAGNIDGTTIGATTPAAGDFTRIVVTAAPGKIVTNTSNGSDNNLLALCAGGDTATTRGGLLILNGNEASSNAGDVQIFSGDTSTGKVLIQAGPSSTLGLTVTQDGDVEIPNDLSVSGTLTVSGTTTTLNTSTIEVEDKNITLAKVSTPTDVTADGGGLTIKGATDKTFNWVNATDAFTSSEHIYLNADDRKLKFGAASGDASIYYDGSDLIAETNSVLVKTTSNQEFMVDDVVRFMINDGNDSVQTSWPIVPMQDDEHDLGTASLEWRDLYIDGTAYLDAVDINNGNIDGTIIGANSAAAGTFTTGTITTADINGGNIDGTTIGATTAAAGTFTTGSFNDITLTDSAVCSITTNSTDGSDNKVLVIGGGGAETALRGGIAAFYGNESGSEGTVAISTGRTANATITLTAGLDGTADLTVTKDGDVSLANHLSLLDDKKIKLGTDSTDYSEIYFTGNALTIKSDDDILIDADDALEIKSDSNQNFYVGETIRFQLHNTAEQITANWPIIPGTDDTYDLGSESTQWQDIYIDGTAYLDSVDIDAGNIDGTTIGATTPVAGTFSTLKLSTTVGQISANTDDGSDNQNLHLCGGGGTSNARGATIVLSGNEATNDGNLYLYSGAHTTGEVFIYAGDSTTLGLKVNQHGNVVIPTDLTVQGTLNVTGSTTTINTSTLEVEDKNITLAKVSTPTDTTADGGGITIKGATDKTFNWVDATDSFTSSEHIHLNGDNRKLILGAASTDSRIYHKDNNFLQIESPGSIVLDTSGGNFVVADDGVAKMGWSTSVGLYTESNVVPLTTDTYDLGTNSLQWQDIYIDGTAYLDTVDIDAGAIDGTTIGANTPAAGDFTRVVLTGAPGKLVSNTADGSDNNIVAICGGGDSATSRGGIISLYGNDASSNPGDVFILSGAVSTGKISLHTGSSSTLGLVVDENQKIGIGTSSPTNALDVQAGTTNTAIVARSTDAKAQISLVDNTTTGVGHVVIGAEGDALFLTSGAGVTALTLDSSQNATFAGKLISSSSSSGDYIRTYAGSGTGKWDIYGNGANLRISDNDSAGIVQIDRGVKINGGLEFLTAGDVNFTGDNYHMVWDASASALELKDQTKLIFGTDDDLQIKHSGAHGYIDNNTGSLIIRTNVNADVGGDIFLKPHDDEDGISVVHDAGVTLCWDGSPMLSTFASGITSNGYASIGNGTWAYVTGENSKSAWGDSQELQIYHDGSNGYINNTLTNGDLILDSAQNFYIKHAGETQIQCINDGSVKLFYDGSTDPKLETTSTGVTVTGKFKTEAAYNVVGAEIVGGGSGYSEPLIVKTSNGDVRFTVDGDGKAKLPDNGKFVAGTGNDLQIWHGESNSGNGENTNYISSASGRNLVVQVQDDANSIIFHKRTGTGLFNFEALASFTAGGSNAFYYDGVKQCETNSNGMHWLDGKRAYFGSSSELQIYHSGTHAFIKNTSGVLHIQGDNSSDLKISPNDGEDSIILKNGAEVALYHANSLRFKTNASGAEILGAEGGDANLFFYADEGDDAADKWLMQAESDGFFALKNYKDSAWEMSLKATGANNVELYYDNSKKLHTFSGGVKFFGTLEADDENNIKLGDNGELELYHGANGNSTIKNTTGWLNLHAGGNGFSVGNGDFSENLLTATNNGAVKLYYDGGTYSTAKLETASNGVQVNGSVIVQGGHVYVQDSYELKLGGDQDLKIYHDGSNGYLKNSTNTLAILTGGLSINNVANATSMAQFYATGAVELYWGGTGAGKKFETTSTGVTVTGILDLNGANAGTYALNLDNQGGSASYYGVYIQCGADDASGTNYAVSISDGDGTTQGHITFSGGTVSYGAFTAHHPCIVPDSENPSDSSNAYPYGTLLETISIEYTQKNGANTERGIRYKVQKTQSANSRKVLGAYGSSMNGGPEGQTNEHQALILGDGHILVNNAGGNIEVGDGICSSAVAGIGQKATANPSMIIGIAQEAITFTGSETKLVAVQYGLQQFIPWS